MIGKVLTISGGIIGAGAAVLGIVNWSKGTQAIKNAVAADPVPLPPSAAVLANLPVFNVRLTGYWPYQSGLSEKERKMEGGHNDRKGKPLITLEMHQKDPSKYPYVSVAGDYEIFPYGQRLIISAWPDSVFRVVDTGGHFYGAGKLYRLAGHEPLDICVDSSQTTVPKKGTTAKIVPGDNWEKGKAVAVAKMKDQSVQVGGVYDVDEDGSGFDSLGAEDFG